jgi:integrase
VQVDALLGALRSYRDRAMAEAMVLGGLRRCEVLGLRLADLQVPARRVFIAEGKGGHERQIPISAFGRCTPGGPSRPNAQRRNSPGRLRRRADDLDAGRGKPVAGANATAMPA